MSFVNLDLNAIPEVQLLPAGEELRLTIKTAEFKESQNTSGLYGINIRFIDPSRPESEAVFQWFSIPRQDDSAQVRRMRMLELTGLMKSFSINFGAQGFEVDESWIGKQGWVILKADEYNGQETRKIDKFITRAL